VSVQTLQDVGAYFALPRDKEEMSNSELAKILGLVCGNNTEGRHNCLLYAPAKDAGYYGELAAIRVDKGIVILVITHAAAIRRIIEMPDALPICDKAKMACK
jgi:hypothetical protein